MNTKRQATTQEIGETLLHLQHLEYFLGTILFELVRPGEVDEKLKKALLRDKETLGQLLKYFGDRVELPENFSSTLDELLKRRNLFVHKLAMEPWFDISNDEGCEAVRKYMVEMRAASKVTLHVLLAVVMSLPELKTTISSERTKYLIRKMEAIVENDFGGLSEEEYIKKVLHETAGNYHNVKIK